MKSLFLSVVILLASTIASADEIIKNSSFTEYQNQKVAQAILHECQIGDRLEVVSQEERIDRVDQGITDVYYTTKMTGIKFYDQGRYNDYKITVESVLFSGYNHNTKDWGTFSVLSVKCDLL